MAERITTDNGGEWWFPQDVIEQIKKAPPVPLDEHGRPKTLLGIPIVYDDAPSEQESQMQYPTMEQVESADRDQLCRWSRFLQSPGMCAIGRPEFEQVLESQVAIMNRILARRDEAGGFTPEISKQIGWA
jgi:hypothetical protein